MMKIKKLIVLVILITITAGCTEKPKDIRIETDAIVTPTIPDPPEIENLVTTDANVTSTIPEPPEIENLVTIDNVEMSVNDTWNVGGGWNITIVALDTTTDPRRVLFNLSRNGTIVEEVIKDEMSNYRYNGEKGYFGATIWYIAPAGYIRENGTTITKDVVMFENVNYQEER